MVPRLPSLMTRAPNQNTAMRRAPSTTTPQRSIGKTRRMHGLDAARAIAIIGLLAVIVGPRKQPHETDMAVKLHDLPLGRATLLFMLLAGIGMSVTTVLPRSTCPIVPRQTVL